jgi:hypothetical protein
LQGQGQRQRAEGAQGAQGAQGAEAAEAEAVEAVEAGGYSSYVFCRLVCIEAVAFVSNI